MIDRPTPFLYRRQPPHAGIEIMPLHPDLLLRNPKYSDIRDAMPMLLYNPSLSITRQYFASSLWYMYNRNEEIKRLAGYDDDDIYTHITYLESVLTVFGLATRLELEQMKPAGGKYGEALIPINQSGKYKTYAELKLLTQALRMQGKVVGLYQGCFDPTHIGHVNKAAEMYPYCDIVLCGFNKNSQVRDAKGPDRPRYSQLAWRMWEMASVPVVDYVFVLPISHYHAGEELTNMCKELGVTVMATGHDNPLLPVYEERMQQVGGFVVANNYRSGSHSSTLVAGHLADHAFVTADVPRMILGTQLELLDAHARKCGYLHDYPDGT